MKRLTAFVFHHRLPIIIVFTAVTIFFAYWIKDIRINSNVVTYLPKEDAAVQLFNHLGEKFKQNDLLLVAVESDDVFTARTLQDIDRLTQAFQGVEGVSSVLSLADMMDIRKAADGGIEIGRLFDPGNPPITPLQLQDLRATVMEKERYRGGIISNDGRTTLIVCQIRSGAQTDAIAGRIMAAARRSGVPEKLHFGGNPLLVTELCSIILHDLRILIPIVSVLIILTLFLSFGTVRGVLIPLGSVLMSTVWVLGLMGLLKVPLTLVSNIIPALLVAIGTAPCIHILGKFDEDVRRYGSQGEESRSAFAEVGIRVVLAALTIVLGFSSFIMGSYLTTIRDFGIFASVGVLFSLLISILFVPAVLASVRVSHPGRARGHFISRLMAGWAGMVVRRRKLIIIVSVIVLALGIAGIPMIGRESEFTNFLDRNNPVRLTESLLQRDFGGSRPLQIDFTGDLANPFVLKEMLRLEKFIADRHLASNPISVADLISEMNQSIDNQKAIPDDRAKVANLMFMLEGQDIVNGLMSDDKDEGQIQAMVGLLESAQLKGMIASLDTYIASMDRELVEVSMASLSPEDRRLVMQYRVRRGDDPAELSQQNTAVPLKLFKGLSIAASGSPEVIRFKVRYTGMPIISWHLDQSVLASQAESLGIAFVFIFALLALKLRSWRGGLLGLAPIILAVAVMFGLMGFTGIPINVATVLVGAIALGIGIDYSIHFSVRFSTYYRGPSTAGEAVAKTIQTTGLAIIINVLAVTMGFIALLFANLLPLRQFGFLTAVAMIGSGAGALTLLPALILGAPSAFMGKVSKEERHEKIHGHRISRRAVSGGDTIPSAGAGQGSDARSDSGQGGRCDQRTEGPELYRSPRADRQGRRPEDQGDGHAAEGP